MSARSLLAAGYLGLALIAPAPAAAQVRRTENLILITLDGARAEDIFGGLDMEVLKAVTKEGKPEETDLYKRYWAPASEERREKLLPFFWGTLMKRHGSIAGNRARGSTVELANAHRFSYPGYSEILTGEARDDVIRSNDKKPNPFPTVLEYLRAKLGLDRRQVAAFASWDVLGGIVAHDPGAITANAGFEDYEHPDPVIRELSRLQRETVTPWDSVRHDVYTYRFARAHLETYRPRILYIGFGETDDWAHDGRYDRVLGALERTDSYLRSLWEVLQSHEEYRDRTTLVITVDHGRGKGAEGWRSHGKEAEGSQYAWTAFVSPDSTLRGEWSDAETIRQDQLAATLCRFLGIDYAADHPRAGKPIERLFRK